MWEQVTITSVVHFHNCPHPAGITIAIFIALSSLQIVFLLSSKPNGAIVLCAEGIRWNIIRDKLSYALHPVVHFSE